MEMDDAIYALHPAFNLLQWVLAQGQVVDFVLNEFILYLHDALMSGTCGKVVDLVFEIGLVLFEQSIMWDIHSGVQYEHIFGIENLQYPHWGVEVRL